MYRILLADDEGIMLESLKMIIESNFGGECEIAFAKTGRSVIELAESFRPDIVFMDIQMPGLNGIQAMKEIRKTNAGILFIVITAYDKFAYAKEAVNLGAMEYLTKPVNRKIIVEVTMKAMKKVDADRQKRSDDLKIREKLETVVPMIESGFIYNILLQDDLWSYHGNYKELLNIAEDYGFVMVMEFGDGVEDGSMTNAVGSSVKAGKFYQEYKEIVKEFINCIVGPVMGNRIVQFTAHEGKSMSYEERVVHITKARNMIHKLESRIESRFRAGMGTVRSIENLKESYQEALRALKEGEGHVVHIQDISSEQRYSGEYAEETEKRFLQLALRGDMAGAVSGANEFFDWMLANYPDFREDIEIKILELVIRLEQQVFYAGKLKYGFRYRANYIKEIQGCGDYEKLREWFLNKTREICSSLQKVREKASESIIEKSKKYIEEQYNRDISLEDVSKHADISPYYFSKLFKQEAGETFIEYLTKTRILHAKEFLMRPEYSIKEICGIAGYSDPNYFSRIFKKYEGITPSEYREGTGVK